MLLSEDGGCTQAATNWVASRTPRERPSDEGKALQEMHLSGWLGRRDSNPDNHVQSVVSYR